MIIVPPEYFKQRIEVSKEYYHKRGLCGIKNLGNTCFMNTIIHCLCYCREFISYFLDNSYVEDLNNRKEAPLVILWNIVCRQIFYANAVIEPTEFHRFIQRLAHAKGYDTFTGYRQNDSQEFLQFFLENIHLPLSYEIDMEVVANRVPIQMTESQLLEYNSLKSWKKYFENEYSPIIDLFYGQFLSRITEINGDFKSDSYEPFSSLPIELSDDSLEGCLRNFIRAETIDYQRNPADTASYRKNILISVCPAYLIIILKRFDNRGHKINKLVSAPLTGLDISPYCIKMTRNYTYDLVAVANHTGSLGGGHYFMYGRNEDGCWYNHNDSIVTLIDPQSVISPLAYVLFYRRID